MMGSAVRVLQAEGFRLHEPLQPVGALPAPLRAPFEAARERAASHVFDAACAQSADLLLLTGSLADVAEEPRLAWVLTEQFRRLHRHGVDVVLAGQTRFDLPASLEFPSNVRVIEHGCSIGFRLARNSQFVELERHSGPRTVAPASRQADLTIHCHDNGLTGEVEYVVSGGVESGRHQTCSIQRGSDAESTRGTMWCVDCMPGTRPIPQAIDCESVRWLVETIAVDKFDTLDAFQAELRARIDAIQHTTRTDQTPQLTLIRWICTGAGRLWNNLADPAIVAHVQQELQRRHFDAGSNIWTWKIDRTPSQAQLRSWSDDPALALALAEVRELESSAWTGAAPPGDPEPLRALTSEQSDALRLRLVRSLRASAPLAAGSL